MGKIMVAKETYVTVVDGQPFEVYKDRTRVDEAHPLVRGNPDAWAELTLTYEVEQATAAPAEKRPARTSTKKKDEGDAAE